MLLDERFVAVQPSLVRSLGSIERAAVIQHIRYYELSRDGRVTMRMLAEETGLSVRTVERIVAWLVENGLVEKVRSSTFDATNRYSVSLSRLRQLGGIDPVRVADSDSAKVADSTSSKTLKKKGRSRAEAEHVTLRDWNAPLTDEERQQLREERESREGRQ